MKKFLVILALVVFLSPLALIRIIQAEGTGRAGNPQQTDCTEITPYTTNSQRKSQIDSCVEQGFVLIHDDLNEDETDNGILTWEDGTTYKARRDLAEQTRNAAELDGLRALATPFVDALPLALTPEERQTLIDALVHFKTEGRLGGE